MSVLSKVILLLTISNAFMLTAWYLHLKYLNHRPWYIASLASWFIAFFEYTVHIPANRIGHSQLSLSKLQILQVGMSLLIFMPFAIIIMGEPIKADYIWAALCLLAAAYFIFRSTT
ncbi:DMT family protein [Scytonema tolypothrichoides VB-61278]|nr:DMT family protein [Scytonema tolypothrichoides VB-61278]